MKYLALLVLILSAGVPVFAQQDNDDEQAIRELGMFGTYSAGNLALWDIRRGNDPIQQMKRFFAEAKLPMTSAQEKTLSGIVDSEAKALQVEGQNEDAARRINADYNKKLNELLTPDQRAELRRYRTEQIMLRGGFPALQLILENGNAPFNAEQEDQVRALYRDFNQKVNTLMRESKGNPDRAELAKLESQGLGNVVKLLTPEQRRVLASSRRGTINSRVRP